MFAISNDSHQVMADWEGLSDTLTTLHFEKDHRLRRTVQYICNFFNSREKESPKQVQERANIADKLTKYNLILQKIVSRIRVSGVFEAP